MKKFSLLVFVCLSFGLQAQIKLQKEITAGFNLASNTNMPFLLRTNQYGTVPFKSGVFFVSPKIYKDYDSLYSTLTKRLRTFDYGFGIEPHMNVGTSNQLLLPQAYVKARLRAFEFFIGRRKEIMGLVDTAMTMGSYSVSGNAIPIPKIEISFQNYVPILGKGLLSIKGNFAHGWFGSTDSVRKFYLHQKSLYVKIGKPAWKVNLQMGLNHQVQWGGYPTKPYKDPKTNALITNYGNDLSTLILAATGVRLGKAGNEGLGGSGSSNEQLNRQGNHLGSVDIAIDAKTRLGKILIYRQSFFEDGSLYYLNNIEDGLLGLNFKPNRGVIRNIGFEYLKTDWQGGPFFSDLRSELRGFDNYFNNGIYLSGWQFKGNTIGTSLINSSNNGGIIDNNQIKAIKIGSISQIKNGQHKLDLILSRNFGQYVNVIDKKSYSVFYSINQMWTNSIYLNLAIAADLGEYWPLSIGTRLALRKIL